VRRILRLPIPRKYVENPAAGALTAAIGKPSQVIHPYMFGDDASKATGIWIEHAVELEIPERESWVKPRIVNGLPRWGNQTDSGQNNVTPGPDRMADRSRTYPGIAKALAVALLRSAEYQVNRGNTR